VEQTTQSDEEVFFINRLKGDKIMKLWRTLYLRAIQALPKKWIDEETRVCVYDDSKIMAANPKFIPMVFKKNKGKWENIKQPKWGAE